MTTTTTAAPPNSTSSSSIELLSTYARIHRPTPYSMALATLMCLHVSSSHAEDAVWLSPFLPITSSSGSDDRNDAKDAMLQKIDVFLQDVLLSQSTHAPSILPNGPTVLALLQQFYKSLHRQEEGNANRDPDTSSAAAVLVHRFHVWLMVATQTMDAFMDLIVATLQRSVASTDTPSALGRMDPTSMMGVFIRSLLVGLDALSFDQMTRLWCCMKEEIHQEISHPSLYLHNVDSTNSQTRNTSASNVSQWTLTKEQLDITLRESIYASHPPSPPLQDASSSHWWATSNDGSSIPTAAHYQKYLDSVQSGDRVAAVHSLYAYMDASFAASSDVLQFASILQAMLHDQFGEGHHGMDAVQEAMAVTQQQPPAPHAAALYAMAWLARRQDGPTHDDGVLLYRAPNHQRSLLTELLQRCIQRGIHVPNPKHPTVTTTLVPSLMMGVHLVLAAVTHSWIPYQNALTLADPGSSGRTAVSNRSVMGATATSSSSFSPYDRPMHAQHLGGEEEDTPLRAMAYRMRPNLVAAGIYNHYSEHSLSMSSLLEVLRDGARGADPADVLVAIRNISILGCTTGSTTIASDRILASFTKIAPRTPMDGKNGCVYGNALRTYISLCDAHHISVMENKLCFLDMLLVFHEWAVHRHDMEHARHLMTLLEGFTHDSQIQKHYSQENMDAIVFQKMLLLSRQGQMDEAKRLLRNFISQCKAQERHRMTTSALLLLATLYLEESSPQLAIRPLLECLAMAKDHKMDGIYTEGLAALAQVHLFFRQYSRASMILQMTLPSLHRGSPVKVQAEAYLTLAKCRLRQATDCVDDAPRRQFHLWQAAIQELQRSRELLERCQDCLRLREIHYLLAQVYHLLSSHVPPATSRKKKQHAAPVDYIQLRDRASQTFLQYNTILSFSAEHRHSGSLPKTTAQFMAALATKDGILKLAKRTNPILETYDLL